MTDTGKSSVETNIRLREADLIEAFHYVLFIDTLPFRLWYFLRTAWLMQK